MLGTNNAGVFDALYGKSAPRAPPRPPLAPESQPVAIGSLEPWKWSINDGGKFAGGFGATEILLTDYWTLRARSSQLFETNIYARGIIRRLITNEINVGLNLEAKPEENVLGFERDSLAEWTETVETRFALWGADAQLCDKQERRTFGAQQAQVRLEALVGGDVLVVMQQDQRTKLPRLEIINGARVQSPLLGMLGALPSGNKIVHGVELDPQKRQVAYWVRQDDGTSKRLPATGEKSGRRIAWLVYGTEQRVDEVRGQPLLGLVLQSLREIDRYRDSTQRKATINSMLAMFIKKTQDKLGTKPISGGVIRKGLDLAIDQSGKERHFKSAEMIPGLVVEELQMGEEPVPFSNHGTDEKFGDFEAAIIQGVAWGLEIPLEILRLLFSNNYSASQAAINEFKIYLNKVRTWFGDTFCQFVYVEWLLAEVLAKRVVAKGLLDSWRDWDRYAEFGAWCNSDWSGHIKPAVDMSKLVTGYALMVEEGFITRDRACRELTGMKFSKVIQQVARENIDVAAARKPLAELEAVAKVPPMPVNDNAQPAEDDAPQKKDGN